MNTKIVAGVIVLLLIGGGVYYATKSNTSEEATEKQANQDINSASSSDVYPYKCENGSEFTMSPSADMSSITVSAGSQGMFSGNATLNQVGSSTRYQGTHNGSVIVLVGAGEEINLTVGSETTVCNPVPNSKMAPWNFGDPGEGGGVKQDISLIVSESIVGEWKSTTDAKLVRTFKADGTITDMYGNDTTYNGKWQVYTKEKPLSVTFPLEANTVYVQMTTSASPEKLNFKVGKLTPESLELVYIDRGGTLVFSRVK